MFRQPNIRLQIVIALLILVQAIIAASAGAATNVTPEDVDKAINAAKEYLYSQQKDGTWENTFKAPDNQEGGVTGIATYALLVAGEKASDPRLAPAIQYLMKNELPGTYALAFKALALSKLPQTPEVRIALKKSYARLIQGGGRGKTTAGLYTYTFDSPDGRYDHSCSQYGLLGVRACSEAGLETPTGYWEAVEKAWRRNQRAEGGWGYTATGERGGDTSTPSMTAAGIASLFIAQDELAQNGASAQCKGNPINQPIDVGLNWIGPHITATRDNYTWYGICRIGMASGYKYIGGVDWYQAGANSLGSVRDISSARAGDSMVPNISYALLFLARGRGPVVMNKLQYDMEPSAKTTESHILPGNWNERPRDAATVTTWIGQQLETNLNWQVVNLAGNVDDFHDAPILYIAGNQPLKFSVEQEGKLRHFIEDGGMIVGNADCGSSNFAESFRKLVGRLFGNAYEFRTLPSDHPIFTRQQFPTSKWKEQPKLMAMSNGVRELAILIPTSDPARAWQTQAIRDKREAFELFADLFLYVADQNNLRRKGVTYVVKPDPTVQCSKTIKVARLQYGGNWDPEPGGWRRLAAVLRNSYLTELAVTPVKIGQGDLAGYDAVHLTGTTAIKFDAAGHDQLKKYVEGGGTLIVDAAGGSTEFAESSTTELREIFGPELAAQLDQPVRRSDPLYEGLSIGYRQFAKKTLGALDVPQLRAIQINNRRAVVFSREDLSGGLVGQAVDGVVGYTPQCANDLMIKLLVPGAMKLTTKSTSRPAVPRESVPHDERGTRESVPREGNPPRTATTRGVGSR